MSRVPVARRMVTADRRRLAVSLIGVGAAIGLVLLVQGLWSGQLVQLTAYEDHAGADLFVAQKGTESMLGDASVVPLAVAIEIGEMSGVISADPVHIHYTVLDLHGAREFVLLVGSRPDGLGGPWELTAGRQAQSGDEVVLDRTLAEQHGLATGDRVTMLGRDLVVVGLSQGTRSWMTSLVFITADAAADLTGGGRVASFILVRTDQPGAVAAVIGESSGLDALTPDFLAANDRRVLAGVMARPVRLMIAVTLAAAALLVSLTVYSAVVERIRDYGVFKAIGAGRSRLIGIVLGQAVTVSIGGTVLGWFVYLGGSRLIRWLRPQFWFSIEPGDLLVVSGGALAMAAVAAVLPSHRLARLDPAAVYRG